MPDDEPTLAMLVLLLLHVPPPAAVSVVEKPAQTVAAPVNAGRGLTVSTRMVLHPVDSVYVMLAVPALTPNTCPEVETTVATEVAPELQVPPPASLSVVDDPIHTPVAPEIVAGKGFTVSTVDVRQPVDVSLYVMIDVPAATPVTRPAPVPTVAAAVLPLLQEPPVVASVRVTVPPLSQTRAVPEIVAGAGLTVTVAKAAQPVDKV
jgi:hypothetical protein